MCLEASGVLVSVVQMLDSAVLVYFKHSSSIGYCHARTLFLCKTENNTGCK